MPHPSENKVKKKVRKSLVILLYIWNLWHRYIWLNSSQNIQEKKKTLRIFPYIRNFPWYSLSLIIRKGKLWILCRWGTLRMITTDQTKLWVSRYPKGELWLLLEVHSGAIVRDPNGISYSNLELSTSHKALLLQISGNRSHGVDIWKTMKSGKVCQFVVFCIFSLWELYYSKPGWTKQSTCTTLPKCMSCSCMTQDYQWQLWRIQSYPVTSSQKIFLYT